MTATEAQSHADEPIAIVVQAGGQSRRMGTDKGLVLLGGRPLVAHVLARVAGLADELLLTTNRPADYLQFGVHTVTDQSVQRGALVGLRTALTATTAAYVLIVACDLPFVEPALLQFLVGLRGHADLILPVWQQREQPLCALYRRERCLAMIERLLHSGERRVHALYPLLDLLPIDEATIQRFDPNGRSFFNVNTPLELAAAEKMLHS